MVEKSSSEQTSDVELVALCNDGSSSEAARAFEALYARHKDYVIRVAMRYVTDPDAALDVLQETFTYLLRKFPPAGSGLTLTAQLTTLLYPVAKNSAITLRRKTERFTPSANVQPDDLAAEQRPASGNLGAVLTPLSEERREVLTMRFVDDMSLQDIADALRIPLGTVKSRLHLGIKQLRDSPDVKKLLLP